MANGSVEEDIQFSLEAIDLDEDIEMIDELFCNEDVEEDCVLSEEEISSFKIADEEETLVSIPPVVFIDEENITCVVVEKTINSRMCNKQSFTTTTNSFTCEICIKIYKIEKN